MIQEALAYLAELKAGRKPVTVEVAGQHYAVTEEETLGDPIRALAPQWTKPVFRLATLSGLVGLYSHDLDTLTSNTREKVAVHIVDPFTVQIVSLLADDYGLRHVYAEAKHSEPFAFAFNKFYEPEPFLIAFRHSFLFNEEAVKVQKVCSQVTSGNAIGITDDGVSQEIVIRDGTVTRASVELPAEGIPLIAQRTFRDAVPVVSKYLLRMKGVKDSLPQIALFEIDARWALDTVASLREYLTANLPSGAIVIA